MEDYILRAQSKDGFIRAFVAKTTNTVNEAAIIHQTTPVATAALGRLLTAGAIIGSTQKNEDDLLTLTIKGDGELKGVVVTANSNGGVKGYVYNPLCDMPLNQNGKLDVGGAIGAGSLYIVKDMGLKEPYTGVTELISGEIADDITYYYAKSEQTPTACGLGVLVETDLTVHHAGGFMVQLMPNAPDSVAEKLEDNVNRTPYITDLFDMGFTPEKVLEILLNGIEYEITETKGVNYYCNCSRERTEKALISIGQADLTKMIEEGNGAELNCHFCNKSYQFTTEDLIELTSTN